jgi:FtsZ-binding cell division protein ZapB
VSDDKKAADGAWEAARRKANEECYMNLGATSREDFFDKGADFGREYGRTERAHAVEIHIEATAIENAALRAEVERLKEDIQALTHEGRQGELERANVTLAAESEEYRAVVEALADTLQRIDASGGNAHWAHRKIANDVLADHAATIAKARQR